MALRTHLPMQEMQEMRIRSLGQEDPLEEEMATHSTILPWKNPMDRGAWRTTVHGVAESDMTEQLSKTENSQTLHPAMPSLAQAGKDHNIDPNIIILENWKESKVHPPRRVSNAPKLNTPEQFKGMKDSQNHMTK